MFNLFRRRPAPPPQPPAFAPVGADHVAWMQARIDWARAHRPYLARCLFDPTSGDYVLHGVNFHDPKVVADYRKLRDANPDLVEAARAGPIAHSCSRVAPNDDLVLHEHRIAVHL